jgi:hypothetical protein
MSRAASAEPVEESPTSVADETAITLHRSPGELRLEALKKEHERLLREIRKRKAACETTEQEARDMASALEARLGPTRDAIFAALRDLRAIFTRLLGDSSPLNRRDKGKVRRLYLQLLPDLATEADDGADPFDDPHAEGPPHSGPFGGEPRPGPDFDAESGYSANKPSEKAGLLRSVFRRLAVALHPDKVQDAAQRETLTAVMKEVTRAYETGDVARLVELERSWLCPPAARPEADDLARRTAQLLADNKELRRQLRSLTAELKELKQAVPNLSGKKRRGKKPGGAAGAEVEELAQQMEHELAHVQMLRDFARSFVAGQISLREFLLGPELSMTGGDDPFDQLLEEILEAMVGNEGAPRGRRGGPRGKRSGRSR